ncbi:MAG: isoprenyl transferase [Massiliimalia sp.]|jgi:undecaprenyl diphosphate synthase
MMLEKNQLPQHIGIIMDGNGRWAKLRGLPRTAGHKVGAKTFRKIVRYCNQIGIPYLTVYAFSTENWKRPQEEVKAIIQLLRQYLIEAPEHTDENVRVKFLGDMSQFDQEIQDLMLDCEEKSKNFTGLHLNIAMNYGGRAEIVHAVKDFCADVAAGRVSPDDLDESLFSQYLYTKGQPDVDLIIRPSGEYRLSNFLIWQSAYAEYVMDQILWPDFNEKSLDRALEEFARRNRRFGGL